MKVDFISLLIGTAIAFINMSILIISKNDSSILVDTLIGAEGAFIGIVIRNMFSKWNWNFKQRLGGIKIWSMVLLI